MHTTLALSLLTLYTTLTTAVPLPYSKRALSTGTKAGLGVGVAVAVILIVLITAFFIIHFRNKKSISPASNNEKQVNASISSAGDPSPTSEPQITQLPRRQKSVKDRLMGPLYKGSAIDLQPMPNRPVAMGSNTTDPAPVSNKPWSEGETDANGLRSSMRSWSSKRATRMMMMM